MLREDIVRQALAHVWPPGRGNSPVRLHGDFWPGNVLWTCDRITAVVDWEDAALGDPPSDLGNARLEVFMHFGHEMLDVFTHQYCALRPELDYTNRPIWDLYAALRPTGKMANFGLDAETLRTFTIRHNEFVRQAMTNLSL